MLQVVIFSALLEFSNSKSLISPHCKTVKLSCFHRASCSHAKSGFSSLDKKIIVGLHFLVLVFGLGAREVRFVNMSIYDFYAAMSNLLPSINVNSPSFLSSMFVGCSVLLLTMFWCLCSSVLLDRWLWWLHHIACKDVDRASVFCPRFTIQVASKKQLSK